MNDFGVHGLKNEEPRSFGSLPKRKYRRPGQVEKLGIPPSCPFALAIRTIESKTPRRQPVPHQTEDED